MKKLNLFFTTPFFLLALVSSSCSNMDDPLDLQDSTRSLNSIRSKELRSASADEVDATRGLNSIALEYVDNAKTLLYATEALLEPSLAVSSYQLLDETAEARNLNPMSLRLKLLDIYDEETGEAINFYDLPIEQREVFVDKLLLEDASTISSRIDMVPGAAQLLEIENEVTRTLIEENSLTVVRAGEIVGTPTPTLNSFRSTGESSKKIKKIDHKKFFSALQKEIETKLNSQKENTSGAGFRSVGGSFNYPKLDLNKVHRAWTRSARPGDFVLAIPLHNRPWVYANIGKNVKFKVGHAGIISSRITPWTTEKDPTTIEAYTDGVQRLNFSEWNTPHYVMGVQRVKYRWRWRGFKSGFYKECSPVTNPEALATWANRYIGKQYVRWYEFATAKWAAPSRFTCTTLVWWCAKKAYGINVSSWYSPLVSPSGLLTDDETYIRENVQ